MAIKTKHDTNEQIWFITFTCYQWIPLFEITNSHDLIYNWLKLIREKYHIETLAFVVMPNHVHLLLDIPDPLINLNTLISNGKRFMAYEIVKRLQHNKMHPLLQRLSDSVSEKDKVKGQKHRAFEPSFDAKPVYSLDFLNQKLDYIHSNPVSGKWSLSADYTLYEHSSAMYYTENVLHPYVDIVNCFERW